MKGEKALGFKSVRICSNPSLTMCQNMAHNLRIKLNKSVKITVDTWAHTHIESSRMVYSLSMVGVDHEGTYTEFNTWEDLQSKYIELITAKGDKDE